MLLDGKTAVVTGARKGIGRAIVELFAQNGARIWACARKQDADFEADMRALAEQNKTDIWPVYFDMTDSAQMREGVRKIRGMKLPVDILVNNAGSIGVLRGFQSITMNEYRRMMDVNFLAHIELTQLLSRFMMVNQSGSIINISSIAGTDGFFSSCDYVSSKAAIIGATRQMARELGSMNIRVNHVSPGVIETDMLHHSEASSDDLIQAIALQRLGRPEDVAGTVLFLASDLSVYITGQGIRVDGGCTSPRVCW